MMFKYRKGEILFAKNPINTWSANLLQVTDREFRRGDNDLLPHKYYHGFGLSLTKDEDSGLFVPLSCVDEVVWGPKYKPVWNTLNKESDLEIINSTIVDLEKIFPYMDNSKI